MRNGAMFLAFASACAGCGASASADYDPPFTTINAHIDPSQLSFVPNHAQAAVGWKLDVGSSQSKLTQALTSRAASLFGANLEIHSLPPPAVMHSYRGISRYAEGVVTIYDDTNGNGQLAYGKRVLGVSDEIEIIYVQGAPIRAFHCAIVRTPPSTGVPHRTCSSSASISTIIRAEERCLPRRWSPSS